jgi:cytochrome c
VQRLRYFGFVFVITILSQSIHASDLLTNADLGYGEYLSAECVTCHKISGESTGIPSISGVEAGAIASMLHSYKSKDRENKVMQLMAGRLDNEQIASLAVYFASLPLAK